jgi:hypothetical protein
MEKYCRAGQATHDNMVNALCVLDTSGYKHTLTLLNNYCFSTATMVALIRLNVALCLQCLPCFEQD